MASNASTAVNTPSDEYFAAENGLNEKYCTRISSIPELCMPSPALTPTPSSNAIPTTDSLIIGEKGDTPRSHEDTATPCVSGVPWRGGVAVAAGVFQQMLCWYVTIETPALTILRLS